MKTVLVTGSGGFIGRNLCASLALTEDITVITFTRENTLKELESFLDRADFIFHLAGVNRPRDEKDFDTGNRGLTAGIIGVLQKLGKTTPLLITSSTQASSDNTYGKSKKAAEELVLKWQKDSGGSVFIYRLTNVFGKWSKPNYNSVVATFCYNISRGLPIQISDPGTTVTLAYIDTVVDSFMAALQGNVPKSTSPFYDIKETRTITLGELAKKIQAFYESRTTLVMPGLGTKFDRYLYATFISYLSENSLSYPLAASFDERGWLAEFIKSEQFGQIFVSKTKPGIARGNHWHHTKIEKFLVVDGEAVIKFRAWGSKRVLTYPVSGKKLEVVDIPPGFIHSIENTGTKELITLFWASEILNSEKPDTYYEEV